MVQVDMAIQDGAGKTKVETHDFRLKAQKTMFGYDSTEKVEGWVCRIFEANGRMSAMEHLKVTTWSSSSTSVNYCGTDHGGMAAFSSGLCTSFVTPGSATTRGCLHCSNSSNQ